MIKSFTKRLAKFFCFLVLSVVLCTAMLGTLTSCNKNEVLLDYITVTGNYQTEYRVGEKFKTKGMVVTAVYTDESEKTLTIRDYTYTNTPLKEGDNTITIRYTEADVTAEKSFVVHAKLVPTDEGDLSDYRFEAEASQIDGTGGTGAKALFTHASAVNSYKFGTEFSGNLCMYNAYGMRYQFTFESDKEIRVKLTLRHGVYRSSKYIFGTELFNYFSVTNNGYSAEKTDPIGTAEDPTYHKNEQWGAYFDMISTDVYIELSEGTNVLVVTPTTAIVNLDYVELHTSAAISGFEEHYIHDPDEFITFNSYPTETSEGRITFKDCAASGAYAPVSYALPVLGNPCYETDVAGDRFITVAGRRIRLTAVNATAYTATIAGGDVRFSDGSISAQVKEGMMLPSTFCRDPYGSVTEWIDQSGTHYEADGFVMPSENVTLTPVTEQKKDVQDGSGILKSGSKITGNNYYNDLGSCVWDGFTPIGTAPARTETDALTVNGSSQKQKKGTQIYRTEGDTEYILFGIEGSADTYFRYSTAYNSRFGTTYALEYTFTNFSDSESEISFMTFIQHESNPYNFETPTITLKPGETQTATHVFTAVESVGMLWTYIVITQDCAGASLGVSARICEQYDAWQSVFGA